ncbi:MULTISPECIES: MG2 domain-containing protein [Myxococcus]|uniref:alpha-2-macroglobulin family protein n=1 Tax=Myxococcus TaxID=32 RepID=UPI001127E140|nr:MULTISPECIES: MG2 domain-containing protein [Myxococcus]QDE94899.1 alpha-2-macroglobulin [Myxococcus xanthus]QDF02159.1 alpha-2-macroglobulin [Myxococcus xanthus]WAM27099.1 MG2 domain-containing protein [Myxococcus sp. NMCA1]
MKCLIRLAALSALMLSGVALAKPLYITVPRSYGTQEPVAVDVAFEDKGPVELRVLKPENLDAFIRAQGDLRRAYQTPPTLKNPGRALSRGFNAVRTPGMFLLDTLNPAFRDEVGEVLPRSPQTSGSGEPLAKVAEGPERLVGVPPGFTVARSQWLNLDLGGAERDFNVPGFNASGPSGFQERRVTLAPLPAGTYVLQMVQGRVEGQVVLVVSDLTVQLKQTDGQVLVRVAGRDQKPREGAEVQVYLPKGKGPVGKTNAKGEVTLEVSEPRVIATATAGGDTAIVDTDFYSALAVAPDVFIYSDRPIYKPGHEVKFRGVVRQPDTFLARLFTPKKRQVQVKLVSQEGRALTTRASVDEFGAFHGTLKVPEDLGTGVLRVEAEVDGHPHQGEARVQDYVKPTFYLEMEPASETVVPGQTLRAKVRARRYAGGTPDATKYEVFLYRSLLDAPAWVDDAGKGGQGSDVTYGSASSTEGKLSVPERLYSSVEARGAYDDPWSSASGFDANGEAEIEVAVPALAAGEERLPYRYSLTVRARDDQETFANATSAFFLSKVEVLGLARYSDAVVAKSGDATLAIRATTLSGKPYGVTQGEVEFVRRAADGSEKSLGKRSFSTAADGTHREKVPTSDVGTVLARVVVKDKNGETWQGEESLLVIGGADEPVARVPNLTLASLSGTLAPGDTAKLVALMPDSWGSGGRDAGPVWVTLSGASLYDTQVVELTGRTLVHSFNVEKRFGSAVYASVAYPTATGRWEERTVAFRVIPRERTLTVELQPRRAEAPPLTEQSIDVRVVDHEGRGVVAQLSVGVVDKAVYAIQSEFRPKVLDFFYPPARNNVSNFFSSEFQGYGYGEALARKMAGLPDHAFASIKPPSRQTKDLERDTAHWDPTVVTDRDGRATVRFTLPSNQTLWVVTAVAADTSGRFGEGTSEFATRGGLNLYAALPQFLREGDEALASVRLSAGEKSPASQLLDVKLASLGALKADQFEHKVELAKGGEQVVPLTLKAASTGAAQLTVNVAGGKDPLRDLKRFDVGPAAVEDEVKVSAWGGGALEVPAPQEATLARVELVLQPSIVDAALSNVRELLTYPYGCLEQLVSTTVPNVAVYQVLQKAGALAKLDTDTQALLAEARSRSVQGTARILDLSVKGGGFTWFGGYETPSLPLTLIALDGLAYAAEAGLVDRADPRLVESARWLEAQEGLPPEYDATRAYVLARLEGSKQAARVRALVQGAEGGDLYPLALAVLAAEKAGVIKEPALQTQINALVARSAQGYATLAALTPGQPLEQSEAFFRFPLRRVGMTAIAAHAASFGTLDITRARRRILELLSEPDLSTFDRSTALLHSLWLLERDAKAMQGMKAPEVKGVKTPVKFAPRGLGLVAVLAPGTRTVDVGGFDGVATLRATTRTPLSAVQPKAEGMSIQRAYYVLREGGKVRLGAGDTVSQGEEVYVELTLDARGDNRVRSAYYVVEDAVPAGFVPLQEDKAFRGPPHSLPLVPEALKRRVLNPERATFFFEEPAWWSDSPRTVGYVLRAQFAGTFSAPPAHIEDMYAASIHGRTAADSLKVVPSKKRLGDL